MTPIKAYEGRDGKFTFLPYHLPEGQQGHIKIERVTQITGTKLPMVSLRNAFLMGLQRSSIILDRSVDIHRLLTCNARGRETGIWMTTAPQEVEQHERQLARFSGNVLMGGLGLGLGAAILHNNPAVKHIIVVEKNPDVIALVKPHLPIGKIAIFNEDLFKFLTNKESAGTYDFAFYDIWAPTGERIWSRFIWRLRKLSVGIVDQANIECWNEDEVIGQIRLSGETWAQIGFFKRMGLKLDPMTQSKFKFHFYRKWNRGIYPFLAWIHKKRPSPEEAATRLPEYIAALKDYTVWKRDWGTLDAYGLAANHTFIHSPEKQRARRARIRREQEAATLLQEQSSGAMAMSPNDGNHGSNV
jgi:hypothetical protein